MKKVLLVGNYGAGNVGDDLLMLSSIQQIHELGADYVLACPGKFEDSVGIPPAGFRSFFKFKWIEFFKELKRCDVVVFGGGGLLNPEEKMSLLIWGQIIVAASIFKKTTVMIGQSFSSIDRVVKFLLSMVDKVSVRDSYSKKLIDEHFPEKSVRVNDLVWHLKQETRQVTSNMIGINLRPYRLVDNNQLKKVVNNLLVELEDVLEFNEICVLSFGKEDAEFASEILSEGVKRKYTVGYTQNDLEEALEHVSHCKFVIAERLHAGITALKLNKPLVSLSYSSKVFSMMSDVELKSVINLRKDDANLDYADVVRLALAKEYKKPHAELDEVLEDVLSEE